MEILELAMEVLRFFWGVGFGGHDLFRTLSLPEGCPCSATTATAEASKMFGGGNPFAPEAWRKNGKGMRLAPQMGLLGFNYCETYRVNSWG